MITQEQISTVLDHPVYDTGGNKIGSAGHVFFDDATGHPEWVTVKTGMFGSSESFVPVHDANVVRDHLEVPYEKDQVKDAPTVDVDAGGHLSEQEEQRLYQYYGLAHEGSARKSNGHRTGDQDASGGREAGGAAGAAAATGGVAGAAAMGGTRTGAAGTDTTGQGTGDATAMRASGSATDAPSMGKESDADVAMTRSEEHMHVAKERRDVGRARLHKYVVTEEEHQTIPLRHEEVRLVREPITDENRDAAMAGLDISEADHEVILHEERAVVEMRTEPVERVRLITEERVEQETVTGTVRKERIEAETDTDADKVAPTDTPSAAKPRGRADRTTQGRKATPGDTDMPRM